jgi:hypothetical protein
VLLDRTHRTWALISAGIMAVATVSYVIYAESTPKGPSGGSLMGLIYGVVGSLMMIYAGLLGGRKQFPFWRLGSAQFWLRGHIWFGTLSFPLILFHAGFGLGGLLEQILMSFFFIVWLSGFFGLAMQHFMPKLLTSRIGRETFSVQIPYIRKRNRILADKMVSADCGKISLDGDPMRKDLTRLGTFAAEIMAKEKQAKGKAAKEVVGEEKGTWLEKVAADDVGLFQDLAKHAKNEGWVNKIGNFPDQIVAIYELPAPAAAARAAGSDEAAAEDGAGKSPAKAAGSPLDQMKGKKAASPLDQMKAKRAMSPLEQMKAKVAAAPAVDDVPLSKLDQIRQQGAFGSGGARKAAAAPAADDAPLSKLDQIRQQGAFGSGGAGKAAAPAAAAGKALSPLEQMKAKAAGGKPAAGGKGLSPLEQMKAKAGGAKPAAGGDKPKSPLDMMKGKAGAGAAKPKAAKPAAKKPPAPVKKKTVVKRPVLRTEELRSFYLTTVRPFLAGSGKKGRLADITEASRAFTQMRGTLPVELHDTLESLQAFCEEHRQFTEQIRIRAWLHYWLAIHIPFSIALFVLMAAHIVLALRVVPWDFPIRF